jgi:hypothetical protein
MHQSLVKIKLRSLTKSKLISPYQKHFNVLQTPPEGDLYLKLNFSEFYQKEDKNVLVKADATNLKVILDNQEHTYS